jgi:hypothetical protein
VIGARAFDGGVAIVLAHSSCATSANAPEEAASQTTNYDWLATFSSSLPDQAISVGMLDDFPSETPKLNGVIAGTLRQQHHGALPSPLIIDAHELLEVDNRASVVQEIAAILFHDPHR